MKCAMCDRWYEPKSEEPVSIFCPECLEIMFTKCFVPNKISAERWLALELEHPEEGDLIAAVTTTQAQLITDSEECDQEVLPWLLLSAAGGGVEELSKGYQKASEIFYYNTKYDLALSVLAKLIKVKTLFHSSYCSTPNPLEFGKFYFLKAKCQEKMEDFGAAEEDVNTAIIYGLMSDREEKDILLRDLCRQSGRVYARLEKYNQAYAMMEKAIYYGKQVVARCDSEENNQILTELNEEQIKILVNEMLKRSGMETVFSVDEIDDQKGRME